MALSNTERIARELMAYYHPKLAPQFNIRPKWLTNPDTGKPLELDIFYPDLQAAVEVDGVHHGRPIVPGLQKNFSAFTRQQRHDRLKDVLCAEWGVHLYRLTIFDLTEDRFTTFLKRFEADNRLLHNRYLDPPTHLFQQAERLSRARAVKRQDFKPVGWQADKPTLWQTLLSWLWS